MKTHILRIVIFLLVVLSFIPLYSPQSAEAAPSYTIDGNSVYTGNGDYFISASPATLTASGWVEVTIKTTNYSGAIDLVYGFNGIDNIQPLKQEFYESYEHTLYNNVEVTKSATITPTKIINSNPQAKDLTSFGVIDKSLNSKVAIIETIDPVTNQSRQSAFTYDTTDGKSLTYKYKSIEAQPYKSTFEDWNKVNSTATETVKSYAGANKYKEIKSQRNITANTFYRTRVWIDIPFQGINLVSGKYNIGVKPSSLTLDQAIAQNKLWLLDPWYNASWAYRKSITVTNASAHYQTKVLIGKTSGATGEEVDCGGNCLDTFADLRFTGADGQTLVDYWVESVVASGTSFLATVWVQNNATPDATLYMYYGNAGAATASSGANTFIVFDDFERGNDGDAIGGSWTITSGNVDISTGQVWGGTRSMKLVGDAAFSGASIPATASDNIAVNFRMYKETATDAYGRQANGTYQFLVEWDTSEVIRVYDGAAYNSTGDSCAADAWFRMEYNDFKWAGATLDLSYNDGNIVNDADASFASALYTNLFLFSIAAGVGNDTWIDNFLVRKWASTEPTFSAFGAEETQGPTVTTQAATSVEATTATGNGNITNLNGGANCTIRGFEWDTDSGAPYANEVHDNGSYGTGAYTKAITGLPTGTTIYCRAYATNPDGTGYGAEVNFLTKPAAPTGVSATDGTDSTKVVVTWTVPTGATHCDVYRDGADVSGWIASPTATYDDAGAGAPTITPGTATASDGTSTTVVTLSLAGETGNNGTTHTYKVIAKNATGNSADSATNTGYRGIAALTYAWQRSAADSDAAYGAIGGGTTDPYNDTGGVAYPDGRYYKCIVSMSGAVNQTSTAERGFMAVPPTVTTGMCVGFGSDWAILTGSLATSGYPNPTTIGIDYGLTTAYGSSATLTGTYTTGVTYSINLSSLSAATVYHYRFKASNGTWAYGADATFSTHGSPTLYESYTTTDNCTYNVYNQYIGYQTITVGSTAHTVSSISLALARTGSPGNVTASIRNTVDSRQPSGTAVYTADAGTNATTIVDSALTSTSNDYYNGWIIYNVTRAISGNITDYVANTKTITCTSIAGQVAGDTYYITGGYFPTGQDIAYATISDAVMSTDNTTAIWYSFEDWYKLVDTAYVAINEFSLQANTQYAIVLKASTGTTANYVIWHCVTGNEYIGGNKGVSSNGGISWSPSIFYDFLFQVWGNPAISVEEAKVFKNYLSTTANDWLITCLYRNFYPPYYDQNVDVSTKFKLQLLDTAGTTIIAETRVPEWGYRPGCIYLNSSMIVPLTWGSAYRVRLSYSDNTSVYSEYALTSTDWIGSDLTRLDAWVISAAQQIEDYYTTTLTTYITSTGTILNVTGGALFARCIPSLDAIRSGVFQVVSTSESHTDSTDTYAYQATITYSNKLGPGATDLFDSWGNILNISGSSFGAILLFLVYLAIAGWGFARGHALAGFLIASPIIFAGAWMGLVSLSLVMIITACAVFVMTMQWIFRGG